MKFLLVLLLGTVICDQAADYVKPEDLAKFNITLTEKLYGGYLAANADGSAYDVDCDIIDNSFICSSLLIPLSQ